MLLTGASSARAADAMSSRTHSTMDSARVQRRTAGGLMAICLLFASTTASSRTTSSAPHSPGPSIADKEEATASSPVKRSRHGEGCSTSVAASSGGRVVLPAERGRGNGTLCAAAKSHRPITSMSGARSFSTGKCMSIAGKESNQAALLDRTYYGRVGASAIASFAAQPLAPPLSHSSAT